MSFLDELTKTRKMLKPTDTQVTTADGYTYIESHSEIHTNAKQTYSGRPPNLVLRPPSCSGYVIDDKPDLQIGSVMENILLGTQRLFNYVIEFVYYLFLFHHQF